MELKMEMEMEMEMEVEAEIQKETDMCSQMLLVGRGAAGGAHSKRTQARA